MQRSFSKLVLLHCVLATVLVAAASPSIAGEREEFDLAGLESKVVSVVKKTTPSVVAIADRGMIFSGVIVSQEGHIISAGHAVRPNASYRVLLSDGRRVRAKGLGVNRRIDMAMLKITDDGPWPFSEMGHSSVLVRNQPCVSISHPGKYDADRGAVVRFGRVVKPVTGNEGMIQTTAKMEPGDSGGPLFDLDGKVIGIHSNIRRSATENYDVPIDSVRKYWDQLNEPERFEVNGWPSLPKLGFRGEKSEDGAGVDVLKVYEGGVAEKSGLLPEDKVIKMSGKKVTSANHIYGRMIELKSAGIDEFDLTIVRNGKQIKRRIELTPVGFPKPIAYPQLTNLPGQTASVESGIDDNVFELHSQIHSAPSLVRATRILKKGPAGSGNLISKSSRVGDNPHVELSNGTRVPARIIRRDSRNDLVLLEAPLPGVGGVDLNRLPGDMFEQPGKFLITPDSKGPGDVSVWGSKYFRVPRTQASGGYLGVVLDEQSGKVLIERVDKGAAQRAGLKAGDFLIRLDEIAIERRTDATSFLRSQDPNSKVTAVIRRDDAELVKEIVLGNRPDRTGHIADNLEGGKSFRRDGFQLAITHDAELRPEECGGPVFDLRGEFLGINISRFSRTMVYAVPKTVLKEFVDSPVR